MIDELLQILKNRDPLAPLCPMEIWRPEISQQVLAATDIELFGKETSSDEQSEMRQACRAGLLLLNDDLNGSHNISQQIETPTGSFWHAIMHRREGDFGNTNYWWLRTGNHPAFEDVYSAAMNILAHVSDESAREFSRQLAADGRWKPLEFVELCEDAVRIKTDSTWRQMVQLAEMSVLLQWCHQRAN